MIFASRLVFIKGQDCLVPRSVAGKIEAMGAAMPAEGPFSSISERSQNISIDEITWSSDLVILEQVVSSVFFFHNEEFIVVSLGEDGRALEKTRDLAKAISVPVRTLAQSFSSDIARFILLAKAHAQWAAVSRFCGACGNALVDAKDHEEVREPLDDHAHGARFCPHCKRIFFPRMSPAVIVLVQKGNAILLEHNVRFPGARHSLIAGFVEIGETIEEAAIREIREEAGIEVKNLRYIKSQPWPFPDSLMLGFIAEWASGDPRPDGVEIDHLDWYTLDSLPELPLKGSIARSILDTFIEGGFSNVESV